MARKMRDSGVEWIGEVPEGWEITPLKKCFAKTFSGIWGTDAGVGEETVTCYRIADFNYAEGIVSTNKLTKRSYKCEELEDKLVRKGDLLLEKSGGGDLNPVGRAVLVNHDDKATCSNFIQALRCNAECDERFVCYMLQTSYSRGVNGLYYNQTIGIQNLQVGKYLSIRLPMPHLPEQRRIADYLDEKCAAIDGAVDELKRGIEDCKAWKKSLIFELVTGKRRVGVFNAESQRRRGRREAEKMKPSGIPWIGAIPEGWAMVKASKIFSVITDFVASGSFADLRENVKYLDYPDYAQLIRTADVSGKSHELKPVYISKESYDFLSGSNLYGGELLLPNIGASVGDVYIVPRLYERMSLAPNAIIVKNSSCDKFYFYFFSCDSGRLALEDIAESTAQPKFNKTDFRNLRLPAPPADEQQAIADYLDKKCAAIDAMVAEKEALIADLESYKKSLIYETVTGKREVA